MSIKLKNVRGILVPDEPNVPADLQFSPARQTANLMEDQSLPVTGAIQTNALLLGLSEDLAADLESALSRFCNVLERQEVRNSTPPLHASASPPVQIIFCGPRPEVVRQIRLTRPDAAIIVVSRQVQVSDWLDALEAGANDYCASPFEPAQICWLLESTLRYSRVAA